MRTLVRFVAALGLVLATAAPAQADDGLVVENVDTTGLPTISVEVRLPASMAGRTPTAEDFAVLVDGVRPRVEVYAGLVDPLEIVLVIDTSGSMRGEPLDRARSAAADFVDAMPATASITVVSFGDTAEVVAAPEDDAVAAIQSLEADGETALYDAVVLAGGLFTGTDTHRVLLMLSDGGDTVSSATLQEAISAAQYADADVRAIALATDEADRGALESIAPGEVATAGAAGELADLYASFAVQLTGSYRLEFDTDAAGPTEIRILLNAGVSVETASVVIDIPEPGTVTATQPGDASAPLLDDSALAVTMQPTTWQRGWTLPAGIVLVFLGALATLAMTLRGRDEPAPMQIPRQPVEGDRKGNP